LDWHIITGEYPPQPGGVSDYTRLVARGLADAGDPVIVWAPPATGSDTPHSGVDVRRLPDRFGPRSLKRISDDLDGSKTPHRLLIQYVPHAFGWKAANLPFCLWLRSRKRDGIWVMFHEVSYPFDRHGGLKLNALAGVNRIMASLVGGAAERAFVSIPAWRSALGAVTAAGTSVTWLPVPSGIPRVQDAQATAMIRAQYGGGRPLIGHFGTYGRLIIPLLERCLDRIVDPSASRVLLLGHGSDAACQALVTKNPKLRDRVYGVGALEPADLSRHISACDVMLQPYPDGISTRRTSAMVALAHGVPLVSTAGFLTEPIWDASGIAVLAPAGDLNRLATETVALLGDTDRRARLARCAMATYDEQFDLRHTIAALRIPA